MSNILFKGFFFYPFSGHGSDSISKLVRNTFIYLNSGEVLFINV